MTDTIEKAETTDTTRNYFETNEVAVPLTMPGHHTMTFFMREVLPHEAREIQRRHVEQKAEFQEIGAHAHRCSLLRQLLTRQPENPLPGFPETDDDANFANVLAEFLDDAPLDSIAGDKKRDLVSNLFIFYWKAVQPAEFYT